MRCVVSVALLVLSAGRVFASGGAWCDVDDDKVELGIQAALTRASGAPFSVEGKLVLRDAGAPALWKETAFSQPDLAQFWFDGAELRLLLYKENDGEPFSNLKVEIRATAGDDEESYDGTYAVSVYGADDGESYELEGSATCSAE